MNGIPTQNLIVPSRALPLPIPDGREPQVPQRGGRYGEQHVLSVMPAKRLLADEGAAFSWTNPTPGTKVDYGSAGTQASFSDTVPFMLFKNNYQSGDARAKRCYLDYLRLIQIGGTAPASTTSVQAAVKVDSKDRQNTAGTLTLITPVNDNMDDATPSGLQVYVPAGAVATIPAAGSAARLVGRAQLKGGPTLLLDEYNLVFGPEDTPTQGGYLTTVASYVASFPPVVLGPQEWAVLHLWLPGGATNPFSFEFEGRHFER